jgi:hypothetical protein
LDLIRLALKKYRCSSIDSFAAVGLGSSLAWMDTVTHLPFSALFCRRSRRSAVPSVTSLRKCNGLPSNIPLPGDPPSTARLGPAPPMISNASVRPLPPRAVRIRFARMRGLGKVRIRISDDEFAPALLKRQTPQHVSPIAGRQRASGSEVSAAFWLLSSI